VTGRLVDRGGAPVAGAPVAFDRGPLSPRVAVRTGADGRFRVSLVAGPGYFLSTVRPPRTPIPAVAVESGREADLGDLALDK
jgi:hypothetical protein